MAHDLTLEQFQAVLPPKLKKSIDSKLVDKINTLITNTDVREIYRDNLLSYSSVLNDGQFKIEHYIEAVRYVSYKLLGGTDLQAYCKTFPDKYQRWLNNKIPNKDISSYVSRYAKTKLVNLIFEQTLVPSHILNADLYQKALNVQAELMQSAYSETVRTKAADSLLVHLRPPESQKIELDVNIKEDQTINELRETTLKLVAESRRMIQDGLATPKEIAHSKLVRIDDIVDGEIINE